MEGFSVLNLSMDSRVQGMSDHLPAKWNSLLQLIPLLYSVMKPPVFQPSPLSILKVEKTWSIWKTRPTARWRVKALVQSKIDLSCWTSWRTREGLTLRILQSHSLKIRLCSQNIMRSSRLKMSPKPKYLWEKTGRPHLIKIKLSWRSSTTSRILFLEGSDRL